MNNKNKILVGCLALLLVLSVGYALFSDTITINGTATAKGEFDINATCQTGIADVLSSTAQTAGIPSEGGYENDSCSVTDDNVSLNVGLLYPGARRYFTVKFTNTGSIDATIALSDITKSGTRCMLTSGPTGKTESCYSMDYDGENSNGVGDYNLINLDISTGETTETKIFGFENENGEFTSMFSENISDFADVTTGGLKLKPNQSVYLLISARVHEDVGNNGSYSVDGEFEHSFDVTFTFPWKQKTTN